MEQALQTVPVTPGFKEFYDYCRSEGLNLVIVSDGLDWAIRFLLSRIGIQEIEVLSNQIIFEEKGHRFNFPYYNEASPKVGVRKMDIALDFKKESQLVYLIGDGRTDFEAAKVVDFVFARDELWDFCKKHHLPSFQHHDFFEILDALQNSSIV
jgi:2,3-diketo-5-methylthio-1-phosphopentane phosphatase